MARKIKRSFRHGDVFSIPLPHGQYLFRQLIFNVARQKPKPGISDSASNRFAFYRSGILINIYRELHNTPTDDLLEAVLVPGVFTSATLLNQGTWEVIANRPVEPRKVEFPEVLIHDGATVFLQRGELLLATSLTWSEYEALPFRPTIHSPYTIGAMGLHYLGLRELIEERYLFMQYLEEDDLRYQPQRRLELYDRLGVNAGVSYNELAMQYGFDLARFY